MDVDGCGWKWVGVRVDARGGAGGDTGGGSLDSRGAGGGATVGGCTSAPPATPPTHPVAPSPLPMPPVPPSGACGKSAWGRGLRETRVGGDGCARRMGEMRVEARVGARVGDTCRGAG